MISGERLTGHNGESKKDKKEDSPSELEMHPRYGTLNKIIIEGSTIFDFIYLQFVLTQNCRYGMKTM